MDALPLSVAGFQLFLVCLARMASLMAVLPVFGSKTAPARVRLGLTVMLALLVFPVVRPLLPAPDFSPVGLALLMGTEAILGLMIGFTAQVVFSAVQIGGSIIGFKMGFSAASVFDPQNQSQIELISQVYNILATFVFLILDIHHLFLKAIVRSYALLPPGRLDLSGEAVSFLAGLLGKMFSLGVQFSAPILVVLLISSLVLGVLSRVFPQLNVLMLSFPLNIGVGFLVMGLTLGMVVSLLGREFGALEEHILGLLQAL